LGSVEGFPARETEVPYPLPGQYKLGEAEVPQFLEFFRWFEKAPQGRERRIQVALRRFNMAYERRIPEDKLLDMVVAFEALLLTNAMELSLRLSMSVANLLKEERDRKTVFDTMRKAYNHRSGIVHGEAIDGGELASSVREVEDLLRDSLRTVLKRIEQGKPLEQLHKDLIDATFT
jgi:hypothetical protein